jgi:hypothetical protein
MISADRSISRGRPKQFERRYDEPKVQNLPRPKPAAVLFEPDHHAVRADQMLD